MVECNISFPNPLTHLIHIELKLSLENQAKLDLILPAWRPGRYELAPFAENIQDFVALDQNENKLSWVKTRPNIWTIDTSGSQEILIQYQYYANKMDAGNSVLNDEQIYINFINCIFFTSLHEHEEIRMKLDIPTNYTSTCSLSTDSKNTYLADNYQQLVDSPLLASSSLKILSYKHEGYNFNIALLGECPIPLSDVIENFRKFSACQIDTMGGFPTKNYDFLVQSLDYNHYHGVEHQNSTILVLGPSSADHRKSYFEKLMGVASHELFHTWNVTRIRPKEMSPYRFEVETMTETGFVTEGFTTYYGDLFLKQSDVFNQEDYFREVNTLFKRHFENYGRHKSSLVASSRNLWVDGYKNLYPSKKVSIYVKGALCAMILDLTIRKLSKNKSCLIDVIKDLYHNHTYQNGGYTKADVYTLLIKAGGEDMPELLNILYESTKDLSQYLNQALGHVGCELRPKLHPDECTKKLGIRTTDNEIIAIAPDSHVAHLLSVGDKIEYINKQQFTSCAMPLDHNNTVEIRRGTRNLSLDISINDKIYFSSYEIEVIKKPSATQIENLNLWLGNNLK